MRVDQVSETNQSDSSARNRIGSALPQEFKSVLQDTPPFMIGASGYPIGVFRKLFPWETRIDKTEDIQTEFIRWQEANKLDDFTRIREWMTHDYPNVLQLWLDGPQVAFFLRRSTSDIVDFIEALPRQPVNTDELKTYPVCLGQGLNGRIESMPGVDKLVLKKRDPMTIDSIPERSVLDRLLVHIRELGPDVEKHVAAPLVLDEDTQVQPRINGRTMHELLILPSAKWPAELVHESRKDRYRECIDALGRVAYLHDNITAANLMYDESRMCWTLVDWDTAKAPAMPEDIPIFQGTNCSALHKLFEELERKLAN
jgi:hypothetical protein